MTSDFAAIVEQIRSEKHLQREVPGFDPQNGNERARFLFLLEAPGPKAVKTGRVSLDNPDQTAKNFRLQLERAGIERKDIAIWNVVPWYLGNSNRTRIRGAMSADVRDGLSYLKSVVDCMLDLECIVLVGGAARQAHIFLSQHTTARILSCHHPSPKVMNAMPAAAEENILIFRFMLETSRQNEPVNGPNRT